MGFLAPARTQVSPLRGKGRMGGEARGAGGESPAPTKHRESGGPSRLPSRSAQGKQGKQAATLQEGGELKPGATPGRYKSGEEVGGASPAPTERSALNPAQNRMKRLVAHGGEGI